MTNKEATYLNHYKSIIESNRFDEYDICGFLIYLGEEKLKGKYKILYEVRNTIAHPNRKRGMTVEMLKEADKTSFLTKFEIDHQKDLPTSLEDYLNYYRLKKEYPNTVVGYKGIETEELNHEFISICNDFSIVISKAIIDDFDLCIFSILQDSIFTFDNSEIRLVTMINKNELIHSTYHPKEKIYICFFSMKYDKTCGDYDAFEIDKSMEALRIDGQLFLFVDGIKI